MKLVKRGEVLAKEGEKSYEIFVLVSGRLGIYKGSIKVEEFSEKGVVVGEMSAILNKKRTASIVAMDDSTVYSLEGNIEKLMENHPDIARKVMVSLAERLQKTTDDFWVLAKSIKTPEERTDFFKE